jgi:hypothetical protein
VQLFVAENSAKIKAAQRRAEDVGGVRTPLKPDN